MHVGTVEFNNENFMNWQKWLTEGFKFLCFLLKKYINFFFLKLDYLSIINIKQ